MTVPTAYVLREIQLNEGVEKKEFETFMLEKFFPAIDSHPDDGFFVGDKSGPDRHALLQGDFPGKVYIWASRVEYFVHATPLPEFLFIRLRKMHDDAQEQLSAFASYTSAELQVFYDVPSMNGQFSF